MADHKMTQELPASKHAGVQNPASLLLPQLYACSTTDIMWFLLLCSKAAK